MPALPVMRPRGRPDRRSLSGAILGAALVGALVGWSTPTVQATPSAPDPTEEFWLTAQTQSGWVIYPNAARPGEVVHIRIRYPVGKPTTPTPTSSPFVGILVPPPTSAPTAAPVTAPVAGFGFASDPGHVTFGRLYVKEGTFGVDLVVPPGTQWGQDPIVVWTPGSETISALVAPRRIIAQLPFVTSRSAQPPLWNR